MRILHVIAQKPFATGSGTYLTGLMKSFDKLQHEQYIIFGINKEENANLPLFTKKFISNPVNFETDFLNFPVVGMSDKMPYKSTIYKDLDSNSRLKLEKAFIDKVKEAMEEFKPDIILIQHLYLITGKISKYIKNNYKNTKIFGFCHGTDLRQLENIKETRDEIISDLNYLDKLFFLHEDQIRTFNNLSNKNTKIEDSKLKVIGSGFDFNIFNLDLKKQYIKNAKTIKENTNEVNIKIKKENDLKETNHNKTLEKMKDKEIKIVFTGKLCREKGLYELLDGLEIVNKTYPLALTLIGSTASMDDATLINERLKDLSYKVFLKGLLKQDEIVKIYSEQDIFVLPSYFEGLPLVAPEAMACGLRLVITDLPGIKNWLKNFNKFVDFIPQPEMKTIDQPTTEGKKSFIIDISKAVISSMEKLEDEEFADLSSMDWKELARRIIKEI